MQYRIFSGPEPTAAALATLSSGTVIKTLQQIKCGASKPLRVLGWGYSFDQSAAATPVKIELIEVDVAATVTAYVAGDLMPLDGEAIYVKAAGGDPTTNLIPVGTTSSGYNATAEGTVTDSRLFDSHQAPVTSPFSIYRALGREFVMQLSKFLRVRITSGVAYNLYTYVDIEA